MELSMSRIQSNNAIVSQTPVANRVNSIGASKFYAKRHGTKNPFSAQIDVTTEKVDSNFTEFALVFLRNDNKLRLFCFKIISSKAFQIFINVLILLNSILQGLGTIESFSTFALVTDNIFNIIFIAEFLLKIIAIGFMFGRRTYLKDPWNWLDFSVVIVGITTLFSSQDSNISALRSLRLLKPLKSLAILPKMKKFINILLSSFFDLSTIILMMLYFLAIFSVFGMAFWSKSFERRCRLSNVPVAGKLELDLTQPGLCGGHHSCNGQSDRCLSLSDFREEAAHFISPEPEPDFNFDSAFNFGITSFSSIEKASYTVFQVSLMEDWNKIMNLITDANFFLVPYIYFTLLISLMAFFVIQMTVAVLLYNFEKYKAEHEEEAETLGYEVGFDIEEDRTVESKIQKRRIKLKKYHHLVSSIDAFVNCDQKIEYKVKSIFLYSFLIKKHVRPFNQWQRDFKFVFWCHVLNEQPFYQLIMYSAVLVNGIIFAFERTEQPETESDFLELVNLVLVCVFTFEVCLQILVYMPKRYFTRKDCLFDFTIVLTSWVEIIFRSSSDNNQVTMISVLRSIRLLRLFRLIKSENSFKIAFLSVFETAKLMVDFVALYAIFIYIYALIGHDLYSKKLFIKDRSTMEFTLEENEEFRANYNFDGFFDAVMTVFSITLGSGWSAIFFNCYLSPFVNKISTLIYFFSITMVMSISMINIFLAYLINNFTVTMANMQKNRNILDFKNRVTAYSYNQFILDSENYFKNKSKFSLTGFFRFFFKRENKEKEFDHKMLSISKTVIFDKNYKDFKEESYNDPETRIENFDLLFNSEDFQLKFYGEEERISLFSEGKVEESIIPEKEVQKKINMNRSKKPIITETSDDTVPVKGFCTDLKKKTVQFATPRKDESSTLISPRNMKKSSTAVVTPKKQPSYNQVKTEAEVNLISKAVTSNYIRKQRTVKGKASSVLKGNNLFSMYIKKALKRNIKKNTCWTRFTAKMKEIWAYMKDSSLFLFHPKQKFTKICQRTIDQPWFNYLIVIAIVSSSVISCLDTPWNDPEAWLSRTIKGADIIFVCFFLFEALIKIISQGFVTPINRNYLKKKASKKSNLKLFRFKLVKVQNKAKKEIQGAYMRNFTNFFDFCIVTISVIELLSDNTSANTLKFLRTLRILRSLRPIRIILKSKSLRDLIRTTIHSIPGLTKIIGFSLVVFYFFAVFGTFLFKEELSFTCTDRYLVEKTECEDSGAYWIFYEFNFNNFFYSLKTLFILMTKDGWLDIMEIAKLKSDSTWSQLFFLIFVFSSNIFLLNLFVTVVIEKFKSIKETNNFNKILSDEEKQWIKAQEVMMKYRPLPKNDLSQFGKTLRVLLDYIRSDNFELVISLAILVNFVLVVMDLSGAVDQVTLDVANTVIFVIFNVEVAGKLTISGKHYFFNKWNLIDFIIVMLNNIAFCIKIAEWSQLIDTNADLGSFPVLLRTIRLLRLFRLFSTNKKFKSILDTFLVLLPSVTNISILLFLLLIIYGSLGVNMFSTVPYREAINANTNFRNIFSAMSLLLKIVTGDGWSKVMTELSFHNCDGSASQDYFCQAFSVQCTEDTLEFDDLQVGKFSCGNNLAVPYFISYLLIGSIFILNLCVILVIDGFSESMTINDNLLSSKQMQQFIKLWVEYDKDCELMLRPHEFVFLVKKMTPPLGINYDRYGVYNYGKLSYFRKKLLDCRNKVRLREGNGVFSNIFSFKDYDNAYLFESMLLDKKSAVFSTDLEVLKFMRMFGFTCLESKEDIEKEKVIHFASACFRLSKAMISKKYRENKQMLRDEIVNYLTKNEWRGLFDVDSTNDVNFGRKKGKRTRLSEQLGLRIMKRYVHLIKEKRKKLSLSN